jgi:prepilin-type N-terminal cleavage/methylation domain-containing protein
MKRAGFSLMELLLVIAIVGVLAGLGTSSFQRYVRSLRVQESTQKVAHFVQQARNRALKQSEAYLLHVSGSELKLYDTSGTLVKEVTLPNGATVAPAGTLLLTGRGLPVQQQAFTVHVQGRSKRVVVLPTGKVVIP